MKVLGIDNVFLQVGDLEEAVRFYHDAIGLPVHKRFDAMEMVLFTIGDETPGLGVGATDDPVPSGSKLWFEVPDARAVAEELSAYGVATVAPPFRIPTGWTVEVRDPWGNHLGFTDYTGMPELRRR